MLRESFFLRNIQIKSFIQIFDDEQSPVRKMSGTTSASIQAKLFKCRLGKGVDVHLVKHAVVICSFFS